MKTARRPSITLLIATIVVTPILAVSLTLVWLSWSSSSRIAESLGDEVMSAASTSVAAEVRNYLGDAVRVSDRYTRRLESGVLPDPPGLAWERPMLDDLATSPTVASICYGNTAGDATWLLRGPGRLEIGRANGHQADHTLEFAVDPADGRTIGAPLRDYSYDPRKRPWWSTATAAPAPTWTPVYTWFAGNSADTTIGTGYTRRISNPDGTLRGVLVVDVTLGALNSFLNHLGISKDGRVYIIDAKDGLVAASHGAVANDKGESLTLDVKSVSSRIDDAPARAHVTDLRPYPGIEWRIVAVLPESAFLADAQRVQQRTVAIGAAAVLASLLLGLMLARHLARPIVTMTDHVKRIGAGDFEARLELDSAKELLVLSDEINAMSRGLRERMALEQSLAVATEVQQCLLPASTPRSDRLDVAGHSKYCDTTGGDYFDYIDVARLSESSLMVVVGDVMGHGIAAALLMATVRAALRCSALDHPSLGSLMTRANQVLAADNRHNRFMTLALLEINDRSRVVTWASAGHDPAIVFDPAADAFQELEGGDMPLGVAEGVDFGEYHSDPIPPGSTLIIGTDGIWEMQSEQGDMYGKDRMRQIVRANHARTAAEIAAALDADLLTFRGTKAPGDDVTFVIVKFCGDLKP